MRDAFYRFAALEIGKPPVLTPLPERGSNSLSLTLLRASPVPCTSILATRRKQGGHYHHKSPPGRKQRFRDDADRWSRAEG
jgi:hypothetical protein